MATWASDILGKNNTVVIMSTEELIDRMLQSKEVDSPLSFEERIALVAKAIGEAQCVLIGAGAGLSTAAGLRYDGEQFQQEFRPWIERYGITDLYSSSFYPWPTQEERWAYWARHIDFIRFRPGAMPLYKALLKLVEGKDYFVITTNVDGQFEKAGFDTGRIFATQGDYAYLQPESGYPEKLYYDEALVKEMVARTTQCRIPSQLVPHCPETGELLTPNLRVDENFVEDEHWHEQAAAYSRFLDKAQGMRLVLLEMGVGFNTPTIIRYPFEQMAMEWSNSLLVRFNRNECRTTFGCIRRFVPFTENLDVALIDRLVSR